jgi:hypothetical protein
MSIGSIPKSHPLYAVLNQRPSNFSLSAFPEHKSIASDLFNQSSSVTAKPVKKMPLFLLLLGASALASLPFLAQKLEPQKTPDTKPTPTPSPVAPNPATVKIQQQKKMSDLQKAIKTGSKKPSQSKGRTFRTQTPAQKIIEQENLTKKQQEWEQNNKTLMTKIRALSFNEKNELFEFMMKNNKSWTVDNLPLLECFADVATPARKQVVFTLALGKITKERGEEKVPGGTKKQPKALSAELAESTREFLGKVVLPHLVEAERKSTNLNLDPTLKDDIEKYIIDSKYLETIEAYDQHLHDVLIKVCTNDMLTIKTHLAKNQHYMDQLLRLP